VGTVFLGLDHPYLFLPIRKVLRKSKKSINPLGLKGVRGVDSSRFEYYPAFTTSGKREQNWYFGNAEEVGRPEGVVLLAPKVLILGADFFRFEDVGGIPSLSACKGWGGPYSGL